MASGKFEAREMPTTTVLAPAARSFWGMANPLGVSAGY